MDMLPVAVLAGGLATRLRPVTERIPKSLVEIAGEPFVRHQLRLLRRQGVSRVVLCLGYLGEMVRDEIGDGAEFGLHVEYSFDGPILLGTAGALRRARELLGPAFFVLYGDSYLECDYRAVQEAFFRSGTPALMTVYENRGRFDTSNVALADGKIVGYDKKTPSPDMHWIDYGLGILRAGVLDRIAGDGFADLADIYRELAAEGLLAGFGVDRRFYEMGSFPGMAALSEYLGGMPGKAE